MASFPSFGGKRQGVEQQRLPAALARAATVMFFFQLKGKLIAMEHDHGLVLCSQRAEAIVPNVSSCRPWWIGNRGRQRVNPRHPARRRRSPLS